MSPTINQTKPSPKMNKVIAITENNLDTFRAHARSTYFYSKNRKADGYQASEVSIHNADILHIQILPDGTPTLDFRSLDKEGELGFVFDNSVAYLGKGVDGLKMLRAMINVVIEKWESGDTHPFVDQHDVPNV